MSRDELIAYCRQRIEINGENAVSYGELKKEKGLYVSLYREGLSQRALLEALGISESYADERRKTWTRSRGDKTLLPWTWQRVLDECERVVASENFLPPAAWFQRNSRAALVQAVYSLGHKWEDLRHHFESYKQSSLIISRSGMHWRSRAEASFSNFLFARNIEHANGDNYPPEYAAMADRTHGKYDVKFKDKTGAWLNVEIWGEKPNGHDEAGYLTKRLAKEAFNRHFAVRFLGIEFMDCYDERVLEGLLAPHIGIIAPFVFQKKQDQLIDSVHWTNADELLAECRAIAIAQPDGKFPSEDWLRKRGRWASRPGPSYNAVSWYIPRWLGGMRNLRVLLGQEQNSTTKWTREDALREYRGWYEQYQLTPGQARYYNDTGRLALSFDERKRAARILAAVSKHVGDLYEVHTLLALPEPRSG